LKNSKRNIEIKLGIAKQGSPPFLLNICYWYSLWNEFWSWIYTKLSITFT